MTHHLCLTWMGEAQLSIATTFYTAMHWQIPAILRSIISP